nr:HlyD family efflux transporter periplasmic adaptor subunit [Wenzhouxiangella sp. XN79A]
MEAKQARLERYASVQEAEREAAAARLATQRDRVARLERQKLGLEVRAGVVGTVLEIDAEEGERLGAGSALARIVDTSHLIARVGVSERDAGRLDIGLSARIEVGRNVIQARVERIDPGVRNRLVDVDLALEKPLPEGLRPDLSVASRIEIDRIENALKLPRPALLEDGSERFTVFRLTEDEDRAMRTQLQLGRRSAREVEVLAGLAEGDRVILADMSDWLDHDELRLQ